MKNYLVLLISAALLVGCGDSGTPPDDGYIWDFNNPRHLPDDQKLRG